MVTYNFDPCCTPWYGFRLPAYGDAPYMDEIRCFACCVDCALHDIDVGRIDLKCCNILCVSNANELNADHGLTIVAYTCCAGLCTGGTMCVKESDLTTFVHCAGADTITGVKTFCCSQCFKLGFYTDDCICYDQAVGLQFFDGSGNSLFICCSCQLANVANPVNTYDATNKTYVDTCVGNCDSKYLKILNDLSDLNCASTARSNLGFDQDVFIASCPTFAGIIITADVNMCDNRLNNVCDPSSDQDAATKYYVCANYAVTGHNHSHNSLTSFDGGCTGEYYHFKSIDYTDLTDGGDSALHYHASDRCRDNHTGVQAIATLCDHDKDAHDALGINATCISGYLVGQDLCTSSCPTFAGAIITADVNMCDKRINNLCNPSGDQDAATKCYVDACAGIMSCNAACIYPTGACISIVPNTCGDLGSSGCRFNNIYLSSVINYATNALCLVSTSERFRFTTDGKFGVGLTPNEAITLDGSLSLKQLAVAPSNTSGYGKMYTLTACPTSLWYKDDAGTTYEITGCCCGGSMPAGSACQMLYHDGATWVTSNTSYLKYSNNKKLYIATDTPGEYALCVLSADGPGLIAGASEYTAIRGSSDRAEGGTFDSCCCVGMSAVSCTCWSIYATNTGKGLLCGRQCAVGSTGILLETHCCCSTGICLDMQYARSVGLSIITCDSTGICISSCAGPAINIYTDSGCGVCVYSYCGNGFVASSDKADAIVAHSGYGQGINSSSSTTNGVYGYSSASSGAYAGIYGDATGNAMAGYFNGCVCVTSSLLVGGSKAFIIDHPLYPETKQLIHDSFEGPERGTIYSGKAKLEQGSALIVLPDYFDALNHPDTRKVYLTPIGGWSPLYVNGDIIGNSFIVKTTNTGDPAQCFSWMVLGVRNDKWSQEHPMIVEKDKESVEKEQEV